MKKVIFFISASLLFLFISNLGMAFNNQRRGFIIGGLGGVGLTIWEEFEDGVEVNKGTGFIVHTDFRIGGGSDRIILYFWGVINFDLVDLKMWLQELNNMPQRHYSTFFGIGVSLYLKATSPSPYICFGLGSIAGWGSWLSEKPGFGFMGGIGYEFTPHWSIEAKIMSGSTTEVSGSWFWPSSTVEIERNILTITLSIIGIAY